MTDTRAAYADNVDVLGGGQAVLAEPGPSTIDSSFDSQRNSLNFLRIVLAIAVVFSHAISIGSFGTENMLGKTTLGTMAVYGFFGLSGYLITASASRNHVGRFLWKRFLRIYPAFWVCLTVTALLFGPLVWVHANPQMARRCGLSCYLHESGGPITYIFHNLSIWTPQSTIAHTFPPGYFRPVWNGSLWTLFFECACYLMLAALSVLGLLRHRLGVLILAVSVWAFEIVVTSVRSWNHSFSPSHHWYIMKMMTFVPVFLGGALLHLYRKKVPDSGVVAWGCALAFLLGLVLPLGNRIPAFTLTSMDLTSVFLVYPLVWLGIHLPMQRVGARNDYSYGIYGSPA
jgi:peptidoglycan/LPS O-acetylase OafA/YrhL